MIKKVDYLIVGQGLAGSFFAFQLIEQGKSFVVIDKGIENSASYVAAGLINPLVLKRLTPSWRVEDFLKYNDRFYEKIGAFLGKKYHYPLELKKLISSKDEIDFWNQRKNVEEVKNYVDGNPVKANEPFLSQKIKAIGNVNHVSWIAISELLKDFRIYLSNNNLLIEEQFEYNQLNGSGQYKATTFNKIIFCEGAKAIDNPFFQEVVFSLNKGQTFTIKSQELNTSAILKKQAFILPTLEENQFRVGATFSWKWEDEGIETEKTTLLKEQIEEMIAVDYSIKFEEAGIRPSAKDRRPIVGKSMQHENFYIFNGMGSRGCMMAPLLTLELFDFIENKKTLSKEINVSRFKPN